MLKLALFLILGAIVNVTVAWGCASFVPVRMTEIKAEFASYEQQWQAQPWAARFDQSLLPGASTYKGKQVGREAMSVMLFFHTMHRPPADFPNGEGSVQSDIVELGRIDAGWPLPTMWGQVWTIGQIEHAERRDLKGGVIMDGVIRGIRQPDDDFNFSFSDMNLLPVRPLWPGFAINTVFYAGVLWLLFAAPFALRRWRRIKRGLCPKCAYPVGTSTVCTECGKALVCKRVLPR